ncbi:glycosyltransferase family 4 protein [Microbacterium capsulatum]|uniref:D-inositol 3-phosphate glycosyltransferase n=1 Tax=Microbacterium capsulatum TaxID=3041921 RepID=A0ABU0XDP6_9MICO|nr:glycosyltransferase family 4 protein [Microbacterium sp. ASV81]MDQ4212733.1 glycosyltransferase family 4 protein [Microbacterium sp. ASV81]
MIDRAVTFLVPEGIDDPARVSGGNLYDRRIRDGLGGQGWRVSTVEAPDAAGATSTLRGLPGGATVLVDGLVGLWAAEGIAAAAGRLRIVVLAHMVAAAFPGATDATMAAERRMFAAADRVVVTSSWTAKELSRRGLVTSERIAVAVPGVDVAEAPGEGPKNRLDLLCVGVVAPHKGQDVLLDALARIPEQGWTCRIVGSSRPFGDFASSVARDAQRFSGRVRMTGVLHGPELAAEYRRGALLVAPSRVESSGMAIAEARGHGVPVVAAAVGGIPDTVAGGGAVLVPPGDPEALAVALGAWMTDPALRTRLRTEVRAARVGLPTWAGSVSAVARALEAS